MNNNYGKRELSPSTRGIKSRRVSADSIKTIFRRRFSEHLRESRHAHLNKLRNICEKFGEDVKFKNIAELKTILLREPDAQELFKNQDINQELLLIENDIYQNDLQQEGDIHEKEYEQEIEAIVNLMDRCQICGVYVNPTTVIQSTICADCYKCTEEQWSQ